MTNTQYNLDDVQEQFEFVLGGHKYAFRYPTTEEIAAGQNLNASDKPEAERNQAWTDWLMSFITPEEGAPSIVEAMKTITVKQQAKFMEMIQAEFTTAK